MASVGIRAGNTSSPVPTAETAPHTFQEALKQGWTVITDKSQQSINQKRRENRQSRVEGGSILGIAKNAVGCRNYLSCRPRAFQKPFPEFWNAVMIKANPGWAVQSPGSTFENPNDIPGSQEQLRQSRSAQW